jgi:hypothetical protein
MSPTGFAIVDWPRFASLGPWGGSRQKGAPHDAHANDAAQAAAETCRRGQGQAGQAPRPQRANAPTARSKSQRGIGPREKVFGPGRLVPLDRNARVRVMMVARALMRHQEKGKGLRQDQRERARLVISGAGGWSNEQRSRAADHPQDRPADRGP